MARWRRLPWRPDILAARIAAWIATADVILQGAEPAFRAAFLRSLARQGRHLLRCGPGGLEGGRRLMVLKGQVFAAAILFRGGRRLRRALARLDDELARQILSDGGHVERSPAQQFAVLRDLVDIRAVLQAGGFDVPHALQNAIDRMAPMLRFFRHGDGDLALFNDSGEGEAWLIDMVLTRAEAPGKPLASAPHAGFERIAVNRSLVVADTGAPPPPGARDHTFAGTLSFEMSIGKERMVVNCGGGPGLGVAWRQGLRATAAHSTLTLADTNSTEILEAPGRGSEIGKHPRKVTCARAEAEGATWLDMSHDGYVRGFRLMHRRRLWLAAGGDELRGEDMLVPPGQEDLRPRPAEPEEDDPRPPVAVAPGPAAQLRGAFPPASRRQGVPGPGRPRGAAAPAVRRRLAFPRRRRQRRGRGIDLRRHRRNQAREPDRRLGRRHRHRPRPGAMVRWAFSRVTREGMTAALASGAGLAGALGLALVAALAGWIATRWVTAALTRRRVLDHPNERSSHSAPTPRGGGIGILVVALPLAVVIYQLHRPADTTALAVIALTAGARTGIVVR